MARLLADENYPRPVVVLLRSLGHDVVTIQELALNGTPDPDVLVHATGAGRVVITEDQGYKRWHRLNPAHAGIILSTPDPDRQAVADRVHAALVAAPSLAGRIVPIVRPQKQTR